MVNRPNYKLVYLQYPAEQNIFGYLFWIRIAYFQASNEQKAKTRDLLFVCSEDPKIFCSAG